MNEKIYDITKEYPDMFRLTIYKSPYVPITDPKKKSLIPVFDSLGVSVRRTKRVLKDYVMCNEFDLFVTFTFDPKKVDRYSLDATYMKMQGWLWRQHRKDPNFQYVIVPEKHKDGAIHFHALMANYPFTLKKTKVIQDNKRVYNISSYRFGFTNATFLKADEKDKAANYIAKYITKDMILISNRRRYWCSKNLRKPLNHRNKMYDLGLHEHQDFSTMQIETEFNVIYQIPKALFD